MSRPFALGLLLSSFLSLFHSAAYSNPQWAAPMRAINESFTGDNFYAGKVGDSYMVSNSFWHELTGCCVVLDGKIDPVVLYALLSATAGPDHESLATQVGRTTGWVLNGDPSPLGLYLLDGPEVSMVMFGTSDIGLMNPTLFETNLNLIIDELFAANSIPVLNTLPPQVGRLAEVNQYNTIILNVASARNVPVSDLYTEVMTRQPVNWSSTLISGDGIHLSGCANTVDFTDANLDTCGYALMNYVNLKTYNDIYFNVLTPSIDLIFSGTTGTGTTGANTIRAKVGDILTLDIVVTDNDGVGICGANLSLYWSAGILTGMNAVTCPSPPNIAAGTCSDSTGMEYIVPSPVSESAGAAEGFFAAGDCLLGFPVGFVSESMTLGRTQFLVTTKATSDIDVGYLPGEVILDGAGGTYNPAATATVKPPSGC